MIVHIDCVAVSALQRVVAALFLYQRCSDVRKSISGWSDFSWVVRLWSLSASGLDLCTYVTRFFYRIWTVHLIVSDQRRPWTLTTPEKSKEHYRPFKKGYTLLEGFIFFNILLSVLLLFYLMLLNLVNNNIVYRSSKYSELTHIIHFPSVISFFTIHPSFLHILRITSRTKG